MMAKVKVNGAEAHPLFAWLKDEAPGLLGSKGIKWNFTKFLVGRDGRVLKRYAPQDAPAKLAADIEAADRMAIFKDESKNKVSIQVKILAFDIPAFGMEMTSKSIARYEIIDRATGGIIYTQEIASTGVVPMSHAFVGMVRARESINRAAQNNIKQFLQAVETVDVEKPMFPNEKK
jgi:hypothetical protein